MPSKARVSYTSTAGAARWILIGATGLWLGSLEIDRLFVEAPMVKQTGFSIFWTLYGLGLIVLSPFLVLIADAERFKPPILADATVFVDAAQAAGVSAEIVILSNRTHYSSIRLLVSSDDPTFRVILDFVRSHESAPRVPDWL